MRPGWTAGVTRARLLLDRTIGPEQARASLLARSWPRLSARSRAAPTVSACEPETSLPWPSAGSPRRCSGICGSSPAGCRPPARALVRALAARFELENIDARLAALAGDGREPSPFELGGLATAWPRIEPARTVEEVGGAARRLGVGRRRGRSAAELALGLRVAWARRVWEAAPEAADWVAGGGALLVARELLVGGGRARSDAAAAAAGDRRGRARRRLARRAAWRAAPARGLGAGGRERPERAVASRAALVGAGRARRARDAAARATRRSVLAAVALLAVDARRTVRALERRPHGGTAPSSWSWSVGLPERAFPVRMRRVAVVALRQPRARGARGAGGERRRRSEPGRSGAARGRRSRRCAAWRAAARPRARPTPALARERSGHASSSSAAARASLLAGEVELERRTRERGRARRVCAVRRLGSGAGARAAGRAACAARRVAGRARLAARRASRRRCWRRRRRPSRSGRCCDTYGAVPYEDVDPDAVRGASPTA